MNHLPVLIVGAGPTGLMMACELERHGILFRIIDKKADPTKGSNATAIQARTLEIFDAIGMADRFLKIGHQCDAVNFYAHGKELARIPLTQIDSTYHFVLMLPQRDTERLLTEKLNESQIRVERSFELIDVKKTDQGMMSSVRLPNGDIENIMSDWVVACDGANSTIREKCHISFPGEDLPEQFMVADAKMSSSLPTNELHAFFDKGTVFPDRGTVFSAFPWGANHYRLTANLYMEKPRQSFTEHEVREIVAERSYGNYIVDTISWISPFWIHSKVVDQMQQGAIFLAGDAAHIHSPIGGQGMNTGLQDAFNLAWKLALVIKKKADTSLLKSYNLERYPIIKNIVTQTDFFTNMVLFDKTFLTKLKKMSQSLLNQPQQCKKIGGQLSQIDIHYEQSPVIKYEEKPSEASPQPGERAPNVFISRSKSFYDYLRNPLHNILIFADTDPTVSHLENIKELQNLVSAKFSDLATMFVIAKKNLAKIENLIIDESNEIHKKYHADQLCIYIVRPDNYIAYYSQELNKDSIEKFLRNYLLVK